MPLEFTKALKSSKFFTISPLFNIKDKRIIAQSTNRLEFLILMQ
nr:MAG TPA: hypothetical protein [Caudoviricetes sp.]DAM58486.1 MAG TPA: hypothetical protein [Bacteriophage sp.]DAM84073.1 MAG TPA: hypothetical protein [Bacteriophage sp.]